MELQVTIPKGEKNIILHEATSANNTPPERVEWGEGGKE